jgi:hypothetical protein
MASLLAEMGSVRHQREPSGSLFPTGCRQLPTGCSANDSFTHPTHLTYFQSVSPFVGVNDSFASAHERTHQPSDLFSTRCPSHESYPLRNFFRTNHEAENAPPRGVYSRRSCRKSGATGFS